MTYNLSTPTVPREYRNWQLSLYLKNALHELPAFRQMAEAPLEAALENVLMQQLLKPFHHQDDLWDKVDEEAIRQGFAEVEKLLSVQEAGQAFRQIERTRQQFAEEQPRQLDEVSISINTEKLVAANFELPRIAPVEKAFRHLQKQNTPEKAAELLLRSALRYASLYSKTRHIGPPQVVYDHFYDWGVRNEGFASPFNARLLGKPEARFHSLFADTDACMGSGGSFFDLQEPTNPGHWCLDPPFLTATMDRVDAIIGQWRKAYPEKSLLYIIPQTHTPAITPDETVLLMAGTHYYEGLDHSLHPLPVNVAIHRYGEMPGFSGHLIKEGYRP